MYSFFAKILSIPIAFAQISGGANSIPTQPNTPIGGVDFEGPFGSDTIETVLGRLAGYAAAIGASVATLMILYGAFQILTSRGNVEQMKSGRKTIIYALSGLVIIILAGSLVTLFKSVITGLGI